MTPLKASEHSHTAWSSILTTRLPRELPFLFLALSVFSLLLTGLEGVIRGGIKRMEANFLTRVHSVCYLISANSLHRRM